MEVRDRQGTMPVVRNGPLPSSARANGLDATVDKDGTVKGTAAPGTRIEIANLSTAPTGHLLPSDVVEVATADANGQFTFKMPSALAGDVLQLQTRASASAAPSSTVQLRVDANDRANDPRAAFVSVKRLRVDLDATTGNATIAARTNLPLCEPDAVLRFTNTRTKASVDVVVDPMGRIPNVTLAAQKGDSIDVAVTDDIATRAPVSSGALTVGAPSLSNPAAVAKDQSFTQLVTIPGRLFLDKLGLGKQGQIGDCPVPAGASAIAAVDPQAIRELIRPRGDGTYVVTFHPPGDKAVEIVVDDKLYARGNSPVYGTGARDPQSGDVELWFPLVEKAYAAHVGSYDVLEKGTSVGKVMADFLGRANTEVWLKDAKPDDVWQRMQRARANGQAMACGTYPSSERALYSGSGLYANHAYSVLGLEEKNGERLVTMRNPWGGAAGFSGEFQLKLDDFVRLYQVLNIC
jgi:hypothetical protein